MNSPTITRTRPVRLHLLLVAALVVGLALSVWPTPSARAADGSTMFAITSTNALLRFDSAAPGTILSTVAVSGLQVGENLLGIDFRPVSGHLYGLGSTSRVYYDRSNQRCGDPGGRKPVCRSADRNRIWLRLQPGG